MINNALRTRVSSTVQPRLNRNLRVSVMAFQPGPADVPPQKAQAQSKTIQKGDTLPMNEKFWVFKQGADAPEEVTVGSLFKGKKAVMFGLPGAYTSVCSSKHVPEYFSKRDELKRAGVDLIACASVNDAYVMRKWAQDLNVDPDSILMLGDADASFHRAIGLTQTLPGLGERARRYSVYLEDGVIKVLNIEEPGGKSYKVSGPSHMLEDLKQLHGKA